MQHAAAIITAPAMLICSMLIAVPSFQVVDNVFQLFDLRGGKLFPAQQRGEQLIGAAVVHLVDELVRLRFLHGGFGDERMAEKAGLAALDCAIVLSCRPYDCGSIIRNLKILRKSLGLQLMGASCKIRKKQKKRRYGKAVMQLRY